MFYVLLISSLRRIKNNKFTYLINTTGLCIGLVIIFILGHIFIYETNFDSFHSNYNRKFLLETKWDYGSTYVTTPPPALLHETIKNHSSVTKSTRVFTAPEPVVHFLKSEEKRRLSTAGLLKVDSQFFDIFDFKILVGTSPDLFSNESIVFCTERFAKRIDTFQSVLGEHLLINGREYLIGGIIGDIPVNSSLNFDLLTSASDRNLTVDERDGLALIYFELHRPEISTELLQELKSKMKTQYPDNDPELRPIPLAKQHIETDLLPNRISKLQLTTYIIIGVIILIVTLSNYANHSITIHINQLRSTGIKKVLGANKLEAIKGIVVESILVLLLATIVAVIAAWSLNTELNEFIKLPMDLSLFGSTFVLFAAGVMLLCVGVITLILHSTISRLQTVDMLAGTKTPKSIGNRIANVIVGLQCIITSIFIILTLTIVNQKTYLERLNTGFNKSNKLVVDIEEDPSDSITNLVAFRYDIEGLSSAKSVSLTSFLRSSSMREVRPIGSNEIIDFHSIQADENFIKLFDIKLLDGINFSAKNSIQEIIVNESAFNILQTYFKIKLGDPFPGIGNSIIVGIVDDFLFNGFRATNTPLIIEYNPTVANRCIVEYSDGKKNLIVEEIKEISMRLLPSIPIELSNFDTLYEGKFLPEDRLSAFLIIASGVSIFISLIGLVGIFHYISNNKRKEMSIRKVFGAHSEQIAILYLSKFLKLLLICFAISAPIGFLMSQGFLSLFAYKIDLGFAFIIGCLALQLIIVVLVLTYQAVRSSTINPIVDLRHD